VRFFPVPTSGKRNEGENGSIGVKALKAITYISEAIFGELLDGQSLAKLYSSSLKLQSKTVLVSSDEVANLPESLRKEGEDIWAIEQRPRVTLGRSSQNASIFHTGRVVYARDCGLWFGIHWLNDDSTLKEDVTELLIELGDAGLGGERSVGFGACRFAPMGTIELPDAGKNPWVCLSRYLPRPDEMTVLKDDRAAYSLVNVGGWLDSGTVRGQRRRAVNLIQEGSVLGPLERPVPGQVVDLRPRYKTDPDPLGHAAYRSGLALAVGLEGGET
jgi:CRISPR-associated protein Csm4